MFLTHFENNKQDRSKYICMVPIRSVTLKILFRIADQLKFFAYKEDPAQMAHLIRIFIAFNSVVNFYFHFQKWVSIIGRIKDQFKIDYKDEVLYKFL